MITMRNYGGDFNTIVKNKNIPIKEAKLIYDNFMKGFPGIKAYQDYCREAVMRDGFILLNPITGHKVFIQDYADLKEEYELTKVPGFWQRYAQLKKENPHDPEIEHFKYYCRRKSTLEKQSINYRIQNRGAMCFKLASIKLFRILKYNHLLDVVKYCIPVHDEINLECPEKLAPEISKVLVQCMVEGAKPFCDKVYLGADVQINTHWVH